MGTAWGGVGVWARGGRARMHGCYAGGEYVEAVYLIQKG